MLIGPVHVESGRFDVERPRAKRTICKKKLVFFSVLLLAQPNFLIFDAQPLFDERVLVCFQFQIIVVRFFLFRKSDGWCCSGAAKQFFDRQPKEQEDDDTNGDDVVAVVLNEAGIE
jgi:hypothetical protein